jgi:hypothetical protein
MRSFQKINTALQGVLLLWIFGCGQNVGNLITVTVKLFLGTPKLLVDF